MLYHARDVLAGQRHAYVKCCKQSKLRGMLASIVSQLSGAKRKRSNAFAGGHASEANLCCELQGRGRCVDVRLHKNQNFNTPSHCLLTQTAYMDA